MTTPNWAANDFIIKEAVVGGASVAALGGQGELLAVRLGVVRSRHMWATRLGDKICVRQTCEQCATMFNVRNGQCNTTSTCTLETSSSSQTPLT